MRIRREQRQVFEQAALRDFEDEMLKHLKKFATRHCEVIGDGNVREVIRLGIYRADKYGLTNRSPVQFYIELMFMFGSDFDTDPQLPWAGWILNATWLSDQMERADQLHAKTMHYLDNVAGPDNRYALDAMRGIRRAAAEGFAFTDEAFESEILGEMKRIYPQKCEYLGTPSLQVLIQRGAELAKKYSVTTHKRCALFIVLMFAVGHGFATDPLFPWISRTLNDTNITAPDKRAERLEAKAIAYLDRALAYLERE